MLLRHHGVLQLKKGDRIVALTDRFAGPKKDGEGWSSTF
jgi:hypothetical protein